MLLETASTSFEDAEPGWSYARGAISRGMDVVLASKGALALHYRELMDRATRQGARVAFSATVGAPLPTLEIALRALISTTVLGFEGIVNSTTNYILTAMADGATYEEGVRRAQALGIAETDPTLDVDGWDAAAKAVILANTILGSDLTLSDVQREGIRGVTKDDLEEAGRRGEAVKLIARGTRDGGWVRAQVAPERRALTDPLGRLRFDEMGVVLFAEQMGDLAVTVGQSEHSGGITTALTVLRDVINLARERGWSSAT
jgi:homoserine dehydrogenase